MSEYDRLTMGDDDHEFRRDRARTLRRWRFSMFLAFVSGIMVTMVAYPRVQPCASVADVAEAAVKNCPSCPACATVNSRALITEAVESAVAKCPVCPRCPRLNPNKDCPPQPVCPACNLQCPEAKCEKAVQASDGAVAARHRESMLARPQARSPSRPTSELHLHCIHQRAAMAESRTHPLHHPPSLAAHGSPFPLFAARRRTSSSARRARSAAWARPTASRCSTRRE